MIILSSGALFFVVVLKKLFCFFGYLFDIVRDKQAVFNAVFFQFFNGIQLDIERMYWNQYFACCEQHGINQEQ